MDRPRIDKKFAKRVNEFYNPSQAPPKPKRSKALIALEVKKISRDLAHIAKKISE
jgi:hypothetical protein